MTSELNIIANMDICTKETCALPLDRATHHNNEGTFHLQNGHFGHAIYELLSALKFVKKALAESCHDDQESPNRQQHSTIETTPFEYGVDNGIEDLRMSSRYVHRCALRVKTETVNQCRDSYTKMASIIIFNLALVHHLRAIDSYHHYQVFQEEDLIKSLRFYEKAYSLQLNEKSDVNGVRVLATLNNLAHVNFLLRDEHKAGKCWQMLLSLIVFITDSCYENENCDQIHCFIGNVTHLILKGEVSAPAA